FSVFLFLLFLLLNLHIPVQSVFFLLLSASLSVSMKSVNLNYSIFHTVDTMCKSALSVISFVRQNSVIIISGKSYFLIFYITIIVDSIFTFLYYLNNFNNYMVLWHIT